MIHEVLRSTFFMSNGNTSVWSVDTTLHPNSAIPDKFTTQSPLDVQKIDSSNKLINALKANTTYRFQINHIQLQVQ